MIGVIGWSLAAVLGIVVLILQWSWRKHAVESAMQSQFIAMAFIDPVIYENNRQAYLAWLQKEVVDGLPDYKDLEGFGELPENDRVQCTFRASLGARNTAVTYIQKLGTGGGPFAILANYELLPDPWTVFGGFKLLSASAGRFRSG